MPTSQIILRFTLLPLFIILFVPSRDLHALPKKTIVIQIYPSYCTAKLCLLRGRLVPASPLIQKARRSRSKWRLMMAMVRRFTRSGIRHVQLIATFQGKKYHLSSDNNGYFNAFLPYLNVRPPLSQPTSQPTTPSRQPSQKNPKFPWNWSHFQTIQHANNSFLPISLQLHPHESYRYNAQPARSFFLRFLRQKGLDIISDLDDTLIKTYVTRKAKMLYGVFFKNATQVEGYADANRLLNALQHSKKWNPRQTGQIYYVTGSPIHLFDRIMEIFQRLNFPLGALSMKYLSGQRSYTTFQQKKYKLSVIRPIIRSHPHRKFVLLGDDGEHDPKIYETLLQEFPSQIIAIFIHHISKKSSPKKIPPRTYYFKYYRHALNYARTIGLF